MPHARFFVIFAAVLSNGCVNAPSRSHIVPIPPQATACPVSRTVQDEPPKDPNASPFGFGNWYVNADRSVRVRSGFKAGPQGNKVIWIRPAGTNLVITGHRLDAPSPPLQVQDPCCYPTGFQVTGILFPSPGCWEVTARAGTSELRFVTEVTP